MKVLHQFFHVVKLKNFALQFEKLWPPLWPAARLLPRTGPALWTGFPCCFEGSHGEPSCLQIFLFVFWEKKCLLFHHLKKKLKDKKKKKKGGWFKRRFYLWEKSSSWPCSSVFYSCPKSKSMVLRKPVPRSKNLVVSYRKEENPTFSTDTTYCSVQHFLCQKKKKKKKEKKKEKNALRAGVAVCFQMLSFSSEWWWFANR